MPLLDRCIFQSSTAGLTDFGVLDAILGYQTPEEAGAVDGQTYSYSAQTVDGDGNITAWEVGTSTSASIGTVFQRTTVLFSSNGNAKVPFASPPQVYLTALASDFAAAGGLITATSNLTWYVNGATGNDSNPGTSGSPFKTIGKGLSVASGYNWNTIYFPSIEVSGGNTYNEELTLPVLVNSVGGEIDFVSGTTTISDLGANFAVVLSTGANWTFTGHLDFGGTVGGIFINPLAILYLNFSPACAITFSGSLAQGGIYNQGGWLFANGSAVTTTTSGMGPLFTIRGATVYDGGSITFSNPVTFNPNVMNLDSNLGFFGFDSATFTNGTNVTTTSHSCIVDNGSLFEANTSTLVDGVLLSRHNFPGVSHGGDVSVDAASTFQPDALAGNTLIGPDPFNGTMSGTNNTLIGAWNGISSQSNIIALSDGAGNRRLDFGYSTASNWTYTDGTNVASFGPDSFAGVWNFNITGNANGYGPYFNVASYGSGAGGLGVNDPQISFSRAQGSVASPSAVANNVSLGSFFFGGWDGGQFLFPAAFGGVVDGVVGSGIVPTALSFRTGTGNSTFAERMRIGSSLTNSFEFWDKNHALVGDFNVTEPDAWTFNSIFAPSILTLATSNMTWYVNGSTGSDSNPGTIGSPFATIQHAIEVAASYSYQDQYTATINVADGVYTNQQIFLPALANCPSGGSIIGDVTTPTNCSLADNGAAYTFSTLTIAAYWTIEGFKFNGTYGAIHVTGYSWIVIDKINLAGSFSQNAFMVDCYATLQFPYPAGGTLTVSASTMNTLLFSRGFTLWDNTNVTFSNPIVFSSNVIVLDSSLSFFGFDGGNFINASNVSTTGSACLSVFNGSYFEGDLGLVDGAPLSRSNFPGHASAAPLVSRATFNPDTPLYSFGTYLGTSSVLALVDFSDTLRADYNYSLGGGWSFFGQTLQVASNSTLATTLALNNSSNNKSWLLATLGSGTPGNWVAFVDGNGFNTPFAISDNILALPNTAAIYWDSTTSAVGGTPDTGLSRASAGVLALGNGTVGNTSGTLELATLNLSGNATLTGPAASEFQIKVGSTNIADYGVTTANNWTFNASGALSVIGNSTAVADINVAASGGHAPALFSTGSAGVFGTAAGQWGLYDSTSGNFGLVVTGSSSKIDIFGTLGWSTGISTYAASDTGLSRTAGATLALGNGTASDKTGILQLASLQPIAGTTAVAPIKLTSGTNLTAAAAGAMEFDGTCFYHTAVASSRQVVDTEQVQILSGTRTLANNASAQAIFNATTNGAITLAGTTTYEFEMVLGATGFSTSSHTISIGFALGGSVTSIAYYYEAQAGTTLAGPTASLSGFVATASATPVIAASTTTGLTLYCRGTIRVNGGGTVTPQITQTTNTAAAVIQANSFFRCWPIGSNTVTNVGDWS